MLNVVPGDGPAAGRAVTGPAAGRAIGLHPDIDVLAFTGSTAVGRHFLHYDACTGLWRWRRRVRVAAVTRPPA